MPNQPPQQSPLSHPVLFFHVDPIYIHFVVLLYLTLCAVIQIDKGTTLLCGGERHTNKKEQKQRAGCHWSVSSSGGGVAVWKEQQFSLEGENLRLYRFTDSFDLSPIDRSESTSDGILTENFQVSTELLDFRTFYQLFLTLRLVPESTL